MEMRKKSSQSPIPVAGFNKMNVSQNNSRSSSPGLSELNSPERDIPSPPHAGNDGAHSITLVKPLSPSKEGSPTTTPALFASEGASPLTDRTIQEAKKKEKPLTPPHLTKIPTELASLHLRPIKEKQASFKDAYQQAVQNLSTTHPHLTPQITAWDNAMQTWEAAAYESEEQENTSYQVIENLASKMPSELSSLVALSQARKLMEDASSYRSYLSHTLHKHADDPKYDAYCAQFLSKLDTINNNLLKIEKAADAIVNLSQERSNALASAATETEAEHPMPAAQFRDAAKSLKKTLSLYCQFGQKMKEGDAPAAASLRKQAELYAQEGASLKNAAETLLTGNNTLAHKWIHIGMASSNAAKATARGNTELAEFYIQAATYYQDSAKALQAGDTTLAKRWSNLGEGSFRGAEATARGNTKLAALCNQTVSYFQNAGAALKTGNNTLAANWNNLGMSSLNAAKATVENNAPLIPAYTLAATYYKNAIKALQEGNKTLADQWNATGHFSTKAAEAIQAGNNHLADQWSAAARASSKAAEATAKDNPSLADLYTQAIPYFQNAIEALQAGNPELANKWNAVGASSLRVARATSEENTALIRLFTQETKKLLKAMQNNSSCTIM